MSKIKKQDTTNYVDHPYYFGNPRLENSKEIAVYTYELETTIKTIEGKILTIIDAMSSDHSQKEALKSLVRSSLWDTVNQLSYNIIHDKPLDTRKE